MKPQRKRRLWAVLIIVAGVGLGAFLTAQAFRENLLFFYSPSEVMAGGVPADQAMRIGGVVAPGSVVREADGVTVRFAVTDNAQSVPVRYRGILPDLFREGQGIVVQGKLDESGAIQASQVLAKHDENYMPPEAADAMKRAMSQEGSR